LPIKTAADADAVLAGNINLDLLTTVDGCAVTPSCSAVIITGIS
jgi:hypothetical protein